MQANSKKMLRCHLIIRVIDQIEIKVSLIHSAFILRFRDWQPGGFGLPGRKGQVAVALKRTPDQVGDNTADREGDPRSVRLAEV